MARGRRLQPESIDLIGGSYTSRSLIAGAQSCRNLYPEINAKDSQPPVPVTSYLTPGLAELVQATQIEGWRCLYLATNGQAYGVVGAEVYAIADTFALTAIGVIPDGTTIVKMRDNGLALVIVDGSATGYAVNLADNTFGTITGDFLGATTVEFLDTYFVFNRPGTNQFYISLSNADYAMFTGGTAFDPLDIAAKTSSPDPIQSLIAFAGQLWLVGVLTSEVWADSGNPEFPFERIAGAVVPHGLSAVYALATTDLSAYWLMQDREGFGMVVETSPGGYTVTRVSTYAIEQAIQGYAVIDDAVMYMRQEDGHTFLVLYFPTADKTWVMEIATHQWHEWESQDANGAPHRHRGACFMSAYGKNVVGDYQNGKLYQLSADVFTDNGTPITRTRSFPHLMAEGNLAEYLSFAADMEVGTATGTVPGPYTEPFITSLRDLDLTTDLKLCLDAGDQASWSGGANQKWRDRSGQGTDFFLGLNGAIGADDPTFHGTVGDLALADYWGFAGAQYFTYDSANEGWMNNLHKAGAKFTMFFVWYSGAANTQSLIGDVGGVGGTTGIQLIGDIFGRLFFAVSNAGANVRQATMALGANRWHISAVSIDAVSGAGIIFDNGVTTAFDATYVNPSAAAATYTLQLGALGNNAIPLPADCRMIGSLIWEGVALTEDEVNDVYPALKTRFDLPSPNLAPPLVSLRWSDTRGKTWGNRVTQSMGAAGEYLVQPNWSPLGQARDRVFELSWSAACKTALNRAFIERRMLDI